MGCLRDRPPRVRFYAAIALGRLGVREATMPLLNILRFNFDVDPYLRHAVVMGLVGANDPKTLVEAATGASFEVRLGILLALRRMRDPQVQRFLNDKNPRLVLEAARAINDEAIADGFPALTPLLARKELSVPLGRRAINATFRLGGRTSAEALAAFAKRNDVADSLRVEAIDDLGEWGSPSGRDKIVGVWRPIAKREATVARMALGAVVKDLLASGPDSVRLASAHTIARLEIKDAAPTSPPWFATWMPPVRVAQEALKSIDLLNDSALEAAVNAAIADKNETLRAEGQRLLVKVRPADAVKVLDRAASSGSLVERQGAFATLAEVNDPSADAVLGRWLDRLTANKVADDMRLDLIEAASKRSSSAIKQKLNVFEASRSKNDPLAPSRETLAGGNARRGMNIFIQKAEVSCQRCHTVVTRGQKLGGKVGPELSDVGLRLKREEILESIVVPNKKIAQGFETAVLSTVDGKVITGVFKSESDKEIRLMTPEGNAVVVAKSDVNERKRGDSAMPTDAITKLSKTEVRSLMRVLVEPEAEAAGEVSERSVSHRGIKKPRPVFTGLGFLSRRSLREFQRRHHWRLPKA